MKVHTSTYVSVCVHMYVDNYRYSMWASNMFEAHRSWERGSRAGELRRKLRSLPSSDSDLLKAESHDKDKERGGVRKRDRG